jgi:hypothetical protein
MLIFFMLSDLIIEPNKYLYPEQEQQQILNFDFMNSNITEHIDFAIHRGNQRNQSHNFQTPEILWKPQLP